MKNIPGSIDGSTQGNQYKKRILLKTLGEIRTFLDEIANGTSNYRSLHSLTEQIEHQYHGRYLIELIQNGHDALDDKTTSGTEQRIEICIVEDEEPYGALYVANDGIPFSDSNFNSLAKLGQSDKDPEESIGNKGIGFRSVLELTSSPQIFSRREPHSPCFDGYCFEFRPEVKDIFKQSLLLLLKGNRNPSCPLDENFPLVEWGESKLKSFIKNCKSHENSWLQQELQLLSPYLLPVPVDPDNAASHLLDFEKRGFATVIRLPFRNDKARKATEEKALDLETGSILFLEKVNCFIVTVDGQYRKIYRTVIPIKGDRENAKKLILQAETPDGKGTPQTYRLWERMLGGPGDSEGSEALRTAIRHSKLPGKWPELARAKVSMAVKQTDSAEKGLLSIYLPTTISSGCGAHFSAPFYGDMSRTDIDFSKPYNSLLLQTLAEKASDVIFNSLAARGTDEAKVIIDLLSASNDMAGDRWWEALSTFWEQNEINIYEKDICLTDKGWDSLGNSSLLTRAKNPRLLTEEFLRRSAKFPVFVEALSTREELIENLYDRVGVDPLAGEELLADTIEEAANFCHGLKDGVNWNDFWHDVEDILSGNAASLKHKKVLLGTDQQLHSSGENSAVFFRPRKLGTDDEILSEEAIDDIPERLRPFIAFLDSSIITHTVRERGGYEQTQVQKFLVNDLVKGFGVEQILRSVLLPAIPSLPVDLQSEKGLLCRDILQWGLRLILSLVAKDKGESVIKLLARFPAPCEGGWYQLSETTFGLGWNREAEDTLGRDLIRYLNKVASLDCIETYDRLLLPPEDSWWSGMAENCHELFEEIGVFRGLRPVQTKSGEWDSTFKVFGNNPLYLPKVGPSCFGDKFWNDYRSFIGRNHRSEYVGSFNYTVNVFFSFPGVSRYESFDVELRCVFMRILFASIPNLRGLGNWEHLFIEKIGGDQHKFKVISPLKYFLQEMAWLTGVDQEDVGFFRPTDRWYVPSLALGGRSFQYSHLNPVPISVIRIFEKDPVLLTIMEELGMPRFNIEKPTADTRLLDDHASALSNPEIDIANKDMFLGMVRNSWSQFDPGDTTILPEKLIVHSGINELIVMKPSSESPVFLPDATQALHEGLELYSKPIVAIEPRDAKRLKGVFRNFFGNGVQLASELAIKPICDGSTWECGEAIPLTSKALDWLPPVVLSIFAFAGQQNRGTGTKAFAKASDTLRGARVQWVDTLEIGLWHASELVANVPVSVYWHAQENVLLAVHKGKKQLDLLSEGLAMAVERADLPVYLKLVLGKISGDDEPGQDELYKILKEVGISQDRFSEVQQHWLGNLSWTIKMIRPIILILKPETDLTGLAGINSDVQLTSYLQAIDFEPLNWQDIYDLARSARGYGQLGEYLFESLGETAQLDKWNSVLESLGETTIEIPEVKEQFRQHLESARKSFRAIIRRVLKEKRAGGLFTELEDHIHDLNCPEDWPRKFWKVEFQSVMGEMNEVLKEVRASEKEIAAVGQSQSVDELVENLSKLGLKPEKDPLDIHAENSHNLKKLLTIIQKTAILWCERENVSLGIWSSELTNLFELFQDTLNEQGFIDYWNEKNCIDVIKILPREEAHASFWSKVESCETLPEVLSSLDIREQDLRKAEQSLQRQQSKREKEKRMVDVCGIPFENSAENLANLWDHLNKNIDDQESSSLDIEKLTGLKPQKDLKKRHTGGKGTGTRKRGNSQKRMTQAMKNLVGYAGEIHVYKQLQKTFGENVVGPDCWLSENSKIKFPMNRTNDKYGCDFEVSVEGKTHCFEVKATTGDDEIFELGSSEIRLAVELANGRKKIFSIIHVMDALSDSPEIRLLPNPYSKKYKSFYQVEDAGLRIRYEAK